MITGNPAIDAKIAMDTALNNYECIVSAKFLVGNYIINNYHDKVILSNSGLNFKVKKCPVGKNSFQVTFNDSTWAIYKVVGKELDRRCGNF
jgi:hypothetical protein